MIKALVFDVFGTVVDWRSSIIAEMTSFGRRKGIDADWASFVDDWRGAYAPSMNRVRKGELPWTNLDSLHRASLDDLLTRYGVSGLDEAEIDFINRAWHRLRPWPDTLAGLHRLKRRFILSTMSNGNVALLVDMAKAAGLPWDMVLSAELCRHYKPDPETYRMAPEFLGQRPDEIMMVAAHNDDLIHARGQGLKTAFVARPTEYGPRQVRDFKAEHAFDVIAGDFVDLAVKLGC